MCAFFVRTTEGESREPELKPKPKPELKLPLLSVVLSSRAHKGHEPERMTKNE